MTTITNDIGTVEKGLQGGTAVPADDSVGFSPREEREAATTPASREVQIREAAYDRFLARGGADGDATADWLTAEAEVDAGSADGGSAASVAAPSSSAAEIEAW